MFFSNLLRELTPHWLAGRTGRAGRLLKNREYRAGLAGSTVRCAFSGRAPPQGPGQRQRKSERRRDREIEGKRDRQGDSQTGRETEMLREIGKDRDRGGETREGKGDSQRKIGRDRNREAETGSKRHREILRG